MAIDLSYAILFQIVTHGVVLLWTVYLFLGVELTKASGCQVYPGPFYMGNRWLGRTCDVACITWTLISFIEQCLNAGHHLGQISASCSRYNRLNISFLVVISSEYTLLRLPPLGTPGSNMTLCERRDHQATPGLVCLSTQEGLDHGTDCRAQKDRE